jgi:hypothetical protein
MFKLSATACCLAPVRNKIFADFISTQRRQDAKQADFFFATLRLGVFALNPFASPGGNEIFSVV